MLLKIEKEVFYSISKLFKFLYVLFFLPFLQVFGVKRVGASTCFVSGYERKNILPPLQKITVEELNNLGGCEKEELTIGELEYLHSRGIATNLYSGRITGFCSEN